MPFNVFSSETIHFQWASESEKTMQHSGKCEKEMEKWSECRRGKQSAANIFLHWNKVNTEKQRDWEGQTDSQSETDTHWMSKGNKSRWLGVTLVHESSVKYPMCTHKRIQFLCHSKCTRRRKLAFFSISIALFSFFASVRWLVESVVCLLFLPSLDLYAYFSTNINSILMLDSHVFILFLELSFRFYFVSFLSDGRACVRVYAVCVSIHFRSDPFVCLCVLFECLLFAVYDYCQLLLCFLLSLCALFLCLSLSLSPVLTCVCFLVFFQYIFVTLYNTDEFSILDENVCACIVRISFDYTIYLSLSSTHISIWAKSFSWKKKKIYPCKSGWDERACARVIKR